jgi:hypothetical protein
VQRIAGEILHRDHDRCWTALVGDFGFHEFLGMGKEVTPLPSS